MYTDAVYIEIRKLPTKKWEFFSALFSGIWGSIVGSVLGTYHPIAVVISAIYGAAASIVSDALIPLLVNDQNTASDGIECGE